MHNIIGTDVASGSFKIRAAALTAAGLVETMKNTDRCTVFAQKGDASAEISKAGLDALLDDKHKSKSVPTHHGVSANVVSADIKSGRVNRVRGARPKIDTMSGEMVHNAKVVAADVDADNGVIYAIDTVSTSR